MSLDLDMEPHKIPEIRIYSPLQGLAEERTCGESESRREVFDMRSVNLTNFPLTSSAFKLHHRSHNNLITRAKSNVTLNPVKSLNLLRQALQKSVNQELDQVMRKYLNTFFRPAIRNIRNNCGEAAISEYHVHAVCRQVLEEAKKMYFSGNHCSGSNQSASPAMPLSELSDSESVANSKKRLKDDLESEESENDLPENGLKVRRVVKKSKRKLVSDATGKLYSKAKGLNGNSERSGFRWNPDRLTDTTKFVLGSRANKALGFGLTRGRLYTKHAVRDPHPQHLSGLQTATYHVLTLVSIPFVSGQDLFRYIGDTEDKQWLSERGLMPASGGRAYLLIMQDIEDLLQSSDYCGVPGVDASEMGCGFTVPKSMITKMKALMESMRCHMIPDSHAAVADDLEADSRPESSIGKRDDCDDGRSLTGDEISNILLNSADVPSTVASPASSSKPFSPNADDSPLVMDPYL